MLIMLLLHLLLHPAQPAALTVVAMETSVARGGGGAALEGERRRDVGWVAKRGEEQEIEKRRVVMKGHVDCAGRGGVWRGQSQELERGVEEAHVLSEPLIKEGQGEGGGLEASQGREATERRVFFSVSHPTLLPSQHASSGLNGRVSHCCLRAGS